MTPDAIELGQWRWIKPEAPAEGEQRGPWFEALIVGEAHTRSEVRYDVQIPAGRTFVVHADRVGELCAEIEFLPAHWSAMQRRAEQVRRRAGVGA